MVAYGICQNTVCSLSYLNPSLDSFRRRVHAVVHTAAQSKTDSPPQVTDWESFHKFFQKGAVCSACGKPMYLVTQPIEGVDAVEDKRREKLNGLLDVAGRLHAWGMLRG